MYNLTLPGAGTGGETHSISVRVLNLPLVYLSPKLQTIVFPNLKSCP